MEEFNLFNYIYIEYTSAILVVTELVKKFVPKPKSKFWNHPKWATLIIGVIIGAVEAKFKIASEASIVDFFIKMILSLGVAVLFYDYVWKVIKDKFKSTDSKNTDGN